MYGELNITVIPTTHKMINKILLELLHFHQRNNALLTAALCSTGSLSLHVSIIRNVFANHDRLPWFISLKSEKLKPRHSMATLFRTMCGIRSAIFEICALDNLSVGGTTSIVKE